MAKLDTRELPIQTKQKVINELWHRQQTGSWYHDPFDWNAYFDYYTRQCQLFLHNRGRHISARTHQELIDIAHYLQRLCTKDELKQLLRPGLTQPRSTEEQDDMLEGSINLSARLLLMMDIGIIKHGFAGRQVLHWTEGSLKEFVHSYFNDTQRLGHENIKLEKIFTARNLTKIAGIEIAWTENLAEHLRLTDDKEKKVTIFHHASFLKWQQLQLFPVGFVEETLNTLALLFPSSDPDIEQWSRKLTRVDSMAFKCGRLRAEKRQIENFRFWHDELVILKQVFDQSQPSSFEQFWNDRRNGVQWYTFWVAFLVFVLTLVFGLIQCIEGALQVYKAYHPSFQV